MYVSKPRCTLLIWSLLLLVSWLFPAVVHAQVNVNGSFEQDGAFSLEGWRFTDSGCREAHEEAPPGGGTWSLKLYMVNVQGGCFSVAYQVIPQVQNGDIWRLTAWVRGSVDRWALARIYWTTFVPSDTSGFTPYSPRPYGAVDTTSSGQWTQLSVVDTLFFAVDDSVGLVLHAGVTGGPTFIARDFAFFDLITTEKIGEIAVSSEEADPPEGFSLAQNMPNPVHRETIIPFTLGRATAVSLVVYDTLGREVARLIEGPMTAGTYHIRWETGPLPSGMYFYRLVAGHFVQARTMVLLR